MAEEVIASLVGRFSFEVDPKGAIEFNKRTDEAKKRLGGLERSFDQFSKNLKSGALKTLRAAPGVILAVGAAAATAALALTAKLTKSFIDSGAELDAFARKAGTTTQELQRLEFAGATTGAEADNVREAYKTLTENLGELARVGSGPAVDSLATLGLTLEDFKGKDATEQMGLMADAMQGLPDDAQRVSVALEIMGEDGGALLPLFQKGSRGIEELADKADRLGVVMDKGAIASAVEAKKSFTELSAVVTGVGNSIAAKLVPKVIEVVQRIQGWIQENQDLINQGIDRFIEGLIPALERVVDVGSDVIDMASDFVDAMGGVENAMIAAAVAAAGFALAVGGLPAIVGAAGLALGFAIADIAGFTDEIDRANASIARLKKSNIRVEKGTESITRLAGASGASLADIGESEFDQIAEDALRGATPENREAVEQLVRGSDINRDAALAKRRRDQAFEQQIGRTDVDLVLGSRIRREAQKKGLGEQAVQTALAKARASTTEGGSIDAAEDAALAALGGLTRQRGGRGGGRGIDTGEAEGLFGDQIRSLADAAGLGAVAIKASMEAAAGSLKRGASQNVALQAATSTLESLSGQKLAAAGSPDAALFGLLTKIGGAETARSATSGARFVRIDQSVNTTNNVTLEIPAQFANAMTAEGQADGIMAALDRKFVERDRTIVEQFGQRHDRP